MKVSVRSSAYSLSDNDTVATFSMRQNIYVMRLDAGMHVMNRDKYIIVPCDYLDINNFRAKPFCVHTRDNKALQC